jgi:hypothetical protein
MFSWKTCKSFKWWRKAGSQGIQQCRQDLTSSVDEVHNKDSKEYKLKKNKKKLMDTTECISFLWMSLNNGLINRLPTACPAMCTIPFIYDS